MGQTSAQVNYPIPTGATTTCTASSGAVTLTKFYGSASGGFANIGTTPVCYRATDGCGNVQDRCFNIIVLPYVQTCTNNLASDSGFETGSFAPNWSADASATISSTNAYAGTKAAQIQTNNHRIFQLKPFSAIGQTTTLSAWVKGTSSVCYLHIKYFGSNWAVLGDKYQEFNTNAPYGSVSITTLPAPAGTVNVELVVGRVTGGSDFFVDDVCFVTNTQSLVSNSGNQNNQPVELLSPFTLIPNPASSSVTISLPEMDDDGCLIEIFDRFGVARKSVIVKDNYLPSINLEDFMAGLYFVRVSTKTQRSRTLKLIVEPGQ
jgi:Secretion system C-terminal sorting domain